jgi:UDP-N-acetylglucosamine 4-epimerase
LVTGAAGFIGSNLVEQLLGLGQDVVGLDDFSTGKRENLEDIRRRVTSEQWSRFNFVEGDIRDPDACGIACARCDYILHQAALGSVTRSIADPITTNEVNVEGFIRVLRAAKDAGVRRVVYASSSSVYGDEPGLPKIEGRIGRPLSPYAVSKYADELYATVFQSVYGLECVGLRYFNVFGRRQDPEGDYAAVIPKWVSQLLQGEPCVIYGDGETSRDFCHVENVVQANLLAATAAGDGSANPVFNIALGDRTTLNELFVQLRDGIAVRRSELKSAAPVYADFRPGDVRHSQAEIESARKQLGYEPTHGLERGIGETLDWYVGRSMVEAGHDLGAGRFPARL